MSDTKKPEDKEAESVAQDREDPCAEIRDPVRRGLCKACGLPVIGEAPFCKDHEMPVP
ncbi:MAG TPA: hypothetical protein VK463_00610 [Desulfomonilaceae bacterium]|nr:hypothetical protein [Desulfomonilaceae bacterium]